MDLAHLVSQLLPLLEAPTEHADTILSLLHAGRRLPDYEIARFLVAKRTSALVETLLRSPDPKQRRSGVRWVELTFARALASRHLRTATKDRSRMVRRAAFKATSSLRLNDVALPDRSLTLPPLPERRGVNPFTKEPIVIPGRPASAPGLRRGWDPTGWRFGLYRDYSKRARPTGLLSTLRDRADVEQLLGVSPAELKRWLRPGAGRGGPYVAFEIPKASGGVRQLFAPRAPLKRLQRLVLKLLLAPLEVHPSAHAFVPGRSTVSNAAPHVGARVLLKLDLVDFFPTIHFGRLIGLFCHYGAGRDAARTLAALVSYRPRLPDGSVAWPSVLPQGAPTSPVISNLVCRRMDARLNALAAKAGASYTRYADDLTFSFRDEPAQLGRFIWWVNQVIGQEGFEENLKKRRVLRPSNSQRVTGLVTNTGLSVPREERRRFRAILHACAQHGVTAETTGHERPRAFLRGFAAYVAMVQPEAGKKLRARVEALLGAPAAPEPPDDAEP